MTPKTIKKTRLCFAPGCRKTIAKDAYFCSEHPRAGKKCPTCGAVMLKPTNGD